MNVVLWCWVLSGAGAALFFTAGSLWEARKNALRVARERAAHPHDVGARGFAREPNAAELARLEDERDTLRASLTQLEQGVLADTLRERDRLRADREQAKQAVREANARTERARKDVNELLTELRTKPKSQRPRALATLEAGARGAALRSFLDAETDGNSFTGAVIADEMGLIVASTGEYGDALAAYGAFLAGVGQKTLGELPLHELRQVVIEDDHDATLTVRPFASADDHLALVTLALGRPGSTSSSTSLERSS